MAMAIEMSVTVEAAVDRVWEAVATEAGLRGWFNPRIAFQPWVGGWVEFAGEHGGSPYRFGGAVVEYEPMRRVTWEWDWVPPRWPVPSLLSIEVAPAIDGTRVMLTHHGWERLGEPLASEMYENFRRGWGESNDLRDLAAYLTRNAVGEAALAGR